MKKAPTSSTDSLLSPAFFQRSIIMLFHFLLLSVPLFFTFNTSELFEFNKMVATYALTAVIVAAWAARMVTAQKVLFKRTYLDIPILIFVISQLLAVIFSIHPYTSLLGYYSRFHGGFASIVTYTLLYYAFVSNIEKKHLPSLFLSTTVAGVAVSLYAILEHFGHSFSCLIVEGGQSFGVDCWIQDVKNRVFASFGQPNWLAAYLVMLLPLGVVLSLKKYASSVMQWFYPATTLLFFIALLFTQSRSGFLGAVLGLLVTIGLVIWKSWQTSSLSSDTSSHRATLTLLSAGVIAIALYWGTPYSPSLATLVSPTTTPTPETTTQVLNRLDVGGTDSGEIRKIVWEGAVKVWQRYPVFGSGLETFAYSYYLDRPSEHNHVSEWDFLYNKAHNEFLNFLATTGLVGLTAYLLLLGYFSFYAVKQIVTLPAKHTQQAWLHAALLGGVAALSVSNFFGFSTVMVTVLMYFFFAIVSVLSSPSPTELKAKEATGTTYLLLSATGLFCIFFLRVIFQYWSADVAYAKGKAYLEAGYFEQGVKQLHQAIAKNGQEATFYDELATQYALYSVAFAQQEQTAQAQALMIAADEFAQVVHRLNPRQLNFYKTRTRVYITLAQLKPEYLQTAKQILEDGQSLAPTDPKLVYNLGIIYISLGETEAGIKKLEQAVAMKPNYEAARMQLAAALEKEGQLQAALEQYSYIIENITAHNAEAQAKIATLSALVEQETE